MIAKYTLVGTVAIMLLGASSNAALVSQYGILDLTANGGINPNTGVAWKAGDQYRLAFHTLGKFDASSSDPAVYNARVTAQANLSDLGNGSITTSTGWTAIISTTTTNARVNTGTNDLTGGAGAGGAGVPVFAMDGRTAIARNNADIWNTWSNPFEDISGSTISVNAAGTGNNTVRKIIGGTYVSSVDDVHYSPFLDQFGDQTLNVDLVHGVTVWTGSNADGTGLVATTPTPTDQRAGSVSGVNGSIGTTNTGNTNANNTTRIWNRGSPNNISGSNSYYALSPLLTVTEAIPEPSTALLGALGALALLRRRRN
jgi:hypothetical protein